MADNIKTQQIDPSQNVKIQDKNAGLLDSNNGAKKNPTLNAFAPEFDVSHSPTINPYGGRYGITTQPVYVPPATILPQQQQPNNHTNNNNVNLSSNDANTRRLNNGYNQPPRPTNHRTAASYNNQQQTTSHSSSRGPGQQNAPSRPHQLANGKLGPQQVRPPSLQSRQYPPNYSRTTAPVNPKYYAQQQHPQMNDPQWQPAHAQRPPQQPVHPSHHPHDAYTQRAPGRHPANYSHRQPRAQHPMQAAHTHHNGGVARAPTKVVNYAYPQNGAMPPQRSKTRANQSPNNVPNSNNKNNNTNNNSKTDELNHNNNNNNINDHRSANNAPNMNMQANTNNNSNMQASNNAGNNNNNSNAPNAHGNAAHAQQQQTHVTRVAHVGGNTQQKVEIKTYTRHPYAKAVGPTMAYKHPNRSHFGQPKPEERDPTFTNRADVGILQRWELLESAKRWLPGEGTFITWKNFRYLIGPPIHMGMNGHIHYCYKYPLPKGESDGKSEKNKDDTKENKETGGGGSSKDKDGGGSSKDGKKRGKHADFDDNDSPCVETLAAKIVPNTPAFAREIVILRALQGCENVTELYEVLESERTLISILELAQADVYNFFVGRGSVRHGWNLDKPAVREHFSKMVISNVVQGLDQMHEKKYLHCDLKSLNILLYIYVTDHSNRRGGVYIKAKLTDFGHSSHGTTRMAEKLFSNGMARVGTAGHVAPELFREGTKCSEKIDIWSLGIVMFSMLVPGRLLFSEYTNLDALKRGYDRLNKMNPYGKDRPSWWTDFERLSPEARDLILWMTRYDPMQRPTCEQILQHPWFLFGKAGYREYYRPVLKFVDMLCSSSIAQE